MKFGDLWSVQLYKTVLLLAILSGCAAEREEFKKDPVAFGGTIAVFAIALGGVVTGGYQ
jgi:hypothetical protein